jgi:hypothetical protein
MASPDIACPASSDDPRHASAGDESLAISDTDVAASSFTGASFRDSFVESDSFLVEVARLQTAELPPPDLRAGHLIAGRYHLLARLGRGGHGEVWRAFDRLTGGLVAIKILRRGSADAVARACREVAALRLLRLPGVVRLVDEGIEDEHPFLVMEHVDGEPFPGATVPCAWPALSAPLVRLLETLGRIHDAGFIHRDLKPDNVLVTAAGAPVLLDFGIARVAGFERITMPGAIIGTPVYLAPEQLEDRPLTNRTDLYAVGVMAFIALTGRTPHDAGSFAELVAERLSRPARAVRSLAPEVPGHVAAVVDRLLALAPEDRPRSAAEAASLLREGGAARAASEQIALPDPAGGELLTEARLRDLFAGPDRVLHLREDAARILFARTSGEPSRVRRELDAWVGAGLARHNGETLAVDRATLDQLQGDQGRFVVETGWDRARIAEAHRAAAEGLPAGAPGRLRHLLAIDDGAVTVDIAVEALTSARRLAQDGALGRAAAHLAEGLFALRRGHAAQKDALAATLAALVEVAFDDGGPLALDRALYELCRPGRTAPEAAAMRDLVRAALAVEVWTPRAAELVEAVPSFQEARLERLRHGVRVQAARRLSIAREEEVLAEVGRWAEASGDPLARASHAHWLGRLRYVQNRFPEAARLHDEAARLSPAVPLRGTALYHAGGAWMESFELDAASARAEQVNRLAEGLRHAFLELQAQWLLRVIAYRSARTDGRAPDLELVETAPLLGSATHEGIVAVTEAAVAYRNGDLATARDLAGRAHRAYAQAGHPIGTVMSRSLFAAAKGELPEGELVALAGSARRCPVPSVAVQSLALVAEAGAPVEISAAELDSMADTVPPGHRDKRLDVLSIDEALAMLARRPA